MTSLAEVQIDENAGLALRQVLIASPDSVLVDVGERLQEWGANGRPVWRARVTRAESSAVVALLDRLTPGADLTEGWIQGLRRAFEAADADLERRAGKAPPDRWVEAPWRCIHDLHGVLMLLSEENDEDLLPRLDVTSPELDEIAERVFEGNPINSPLSSIGVNEREARVLRGAFAACFELVPDGMVHAMMGRDTEELRVSEAELAKAIDALDKPKTLDP